MTIGVEFGAKDVCIGDAQVCLLCHIFLGGDRLIGLFSIFDCYTAKPSAPRSKYEQFLVSVISNSTLTSQGTADDSST